MSKIQGSLSQAFRMPTDTGSTKDKSKTSDKSVSSDSRSSQSKSADDLPGVGLLGGAQGDLSQEGFNADEQSAGVLEVVEERQRRLKEDGLGDKLLGGGVEQHDSVLHRNLRNDVPVQRAEGPSAIENVQALEQRTGVRQVSRSSRSVSRQVAEESQEASAVGQRPKGPALDDDLPRVGLNKN